MKTWTQRILAVPAALLALVVGFVLGAQIREASASGLLGIPPTISINRIQGRASTSAFNIGDGGGSGTETFTCDSTAANATCILNSTGATTGGVVIQANGTTGLTVGGGAAQVNVAGSGTYSVNIGNGTQTINLGGGSTFNFLKKFSSSLTPTAVTANTCTNPAADQIVASGLTAGDACFAVGPNTGGISFFCNVTSATVIQLTFCNVSTSSNTPTSGTYLAWVIH